MKKTILGSLILSSIAINTHALTPLNDEALSRIDGQALLNMSAQVGTSIKGVEVDPNDPSKQISTTYDQTDLTFYKLGLNADVELNANIKKLQLGCGGINGPNKCDIDIDHLSLSGVSDISDDRASSSSLLKNPFLQFAIKNATSASKREIVGFRLSAEAIDGLLTFGTNNENKNGINSLSGYMITDNAKGTVKTAAVTSGLTQQNLGTVITGLAKSSTGLITTPFKSTSYDIKLSSANGSLNLPSQVIVGSRMTTAYLKGTSIVSGIKQSGTIAADATLLGLTIPIEGDLDGTINNLGVNVDISEDLGYFHKIKLNGTPASLSLQTQKIIWADGATVAKSVAQKGWWLELSNPIDIGDVSPAKEVTITNAAVSATLDKVSAYLAKKENAVDCGFLTTSCLLAGKINTGTVDLTGQYVPMSLSNLTIANQNFAPNCFGGLKFC